MSTTLQRRAPLIAMGVALMLVAMMVTRTSQAAFTASTDNLGNSFSAGDLELTDDRATAMFALTDLAPGDSQTGCIQVTYSGSITTPSAVKLYSGGYVDVPGPDGASVGLSGYLNLTVVEGTAGSTCATFAAGTPVVATTTLAAFDAASFDYTNGASGWTPTSTPEMRAYEFTVELDADTPTEEQSATTNAVGFVWEIQA